MAGQKCPAAKTVPRPKELRSLATLHTDTSTALHRYCIGYQYIGYIGQKYWYQLSAIKQNVYWWPTFQILVWNLDVKMYWKFEQSCIYPIGDWYQQISIVGYQLKFHIGACMCVTTNVSWLHLAVSSVAVHALSHIKASQLNSITDWIYVAVATKAVASQI